MIAIDLAASFNLHHSCFDDTIASDFYSVRRGIFARASGAPAIPAYGQTEAVGSAPRATLVNYIITVSVGEGGGCVMLGRFSKVRA